MRTCDNAGSDPDNLHYRRYILLVIVVVYLLVGGVLL
jgi:hypothetical protein